MWFGDLKTRNRLIKELLCLAKEADEIKLKIEEKKTAKGEQMNESNCPDMAKNMDEDHDATGPALRFRTSSTELITYDKLTARIMVTMVGGALIVAVVGIIKFCTDNPQVVEKVASQPKSSAFWKIWEFLLRIFKNS